jgi:hypothetical protein
MLAPPLLLRSDLPIAVHPCATREGPFAYGPHNCFWQLNHLRFVERMDPRLQAYLAFAFTRSNRMDFLRAVEEPPTTDALRSFTGRKHDVWETGTWLQVSGRRRRCRRCTRDLPRASLARVAARTRRPRQTPIGAFSISSSSNAPCRSPCLPRHNTVRSVVEPLRNRSHVAKTGCR